MDNYTKEQLVEIVKELIEMHKYFRSNKHLESSDQHAEIANEQIYTIENGEWE